MIIAEFDTTKGRREAELVKENTHTVLVKLRSAGKVKTIKRHKLKHRVRMTGDI